MFFIVSRSRLKLRKPLAHVALCRSSTAQLANDLKNVLQLFFHFMSFCAFFMARSAAAH